MLWSGVTQGTLHSGNLVGLDRHANFKRSYTIFKGFLGINWTQRLLEACLPASYTRGRPLEPLKLLSNPSRDVAGDVHLGSQSAVW